MDDEKLIELVRKYEFLYNLQHPKYMDGLKKEMAWKDISDQLKQPGIFVSPMDFTSRFNQANKSKQVIITQEADGRAIFSCTECSMQYEDKESMELHLCMHNKEYRFLCVICGTGFKRKVHLDRHVLEHQEVRPHVCSNCGRSFKRKEHLNIHRNKMHNSICPKPTVEIRGRQAVITKGPDGTRFRCTGCPSVFTTKKDIELHLCVHNKEYRFLCVICGTGLKRKEHLERHMLEHQEVRPHVCDECGKGFKRKEHLNIHYNIHTNKRDQVCPLCDRSFHRKDHLQKHLQTHNKQFLKHGLVPVGDEELEQVKEEPMDEEQQDPLLTPEADVNNFGTDVSNFEADVSNYETDVSNADFEQAQSAEEYKERLQTPQMSGDPEKPYACCVCLKSFRKKDHLKLHSHMHLKNKFCSQCGKGFQNSEQLLTHMSEHLHSRSLLESEQDYQDGDEQMTLLVPRSVANPYERPHQCPICFKRFKRRQHLKTHGSVHSKGAAPAQPECSVWCSLCHQGFVTNEDFENHECPAPNGLENPERADAENIQEQGEPHDQDYSNIEYQNIISTFRPVPIVDCRDQPAPPDLAEQHLPVPIKVFVCRYCSKHFRRKDHYRIHLNVHTGVKTLFCKDCGKGFYRKDHLQKHAQVHNKKPKLKKIPELFPISLISKKLPEITIHATSSSKLRLPLQMKVPYQVVTSSESGEMRSAVVNPT